MHISVYIIYVYKLNEKWNKIILGDFTKVFYVNLDKEKFRYVIIAAH